LVVNLLTEYAVRHHPADGPKFQLKIGVRDLLVKDESNTNRRWPIHFGKNKHSSSQIISFIISVNKIKSLSITSLSIDLLVTLELFSLYYYHLPLTFKLTFAFLGLSCTLKDAVSSVFCGACLCDSL